jgi:hypothetical protein
MAQAQPAVEQPATESTDVEALLDAKFGLSEPEQPEQPEQEAQQGEDAPALEESEEAPADQPELVEVEIDGETWQVPPKIKERMLAHADYTKKTTETANTRRLLEVQQKEVALFREQRAFEESVAADLDNLKMLDAYVQHVERNTEWAKLTTDQIVRARLELDQLKAQRGELANVLKGKRDEFSQKMSGEREKLKKESAEVVSKAIPNWNDEARSSVEKYVQSLGYPELATASMSALDYQVAWKAMQYDKIKAETKTAFKKAADAPVIAQSARKTAMPKQVRAKLELKNAVKSGNREKIAAGLDARLDQMFGG